MDREEIQTAVVRMPKVELHVHLEGATDAETVWQMAQRNNIALPADSLESWKECFAFRDFAHFVEVYTQSAAVMKTTADWELMVDRFMEAQAKQNIVYSEVFLSASYVVQAMRPQEWIDALVKAASLGEQRYGTRIRFIPDIGREMPNTQEAVLDCVVSAKQTGFFVGLGIGGPEQGFPPRLFVETFGRAREAGLHVVAHAGETTGPDTIRDSIDLLRAERIGHGIRVLDDPRLVERLRHEQIPFEVCPTSNYCLGVVPRNQPHPIRQMVEEGLLCTLNSDDPPMFGTSLVGEYQLLIEQGFTWPELIQLNLNAIDVSFLSATEKQQLRGTVLQQTEESNIVPTRKTEHFEFDGEQYTRTSTHQKEWGTSRVSQLELRGDERVLDVGCGDGGLTAQIANGVPRGAVLGIDSSRGMLQAAGKHGCHNLAFQRLAIEDADFVSEFDVIFSNAALHWVKDHVRLLETLHRALVNGGVLRVEFAAAGNCQALFQVTHQLMDNEFRKAFSGFEWPWFMPRIDDYEQLLASSPFGDFKVWGENKDRYFPDKESLLGWLSQPAIVPFKQFVDDATGERFHEEVARRLLEATRQPDGTYFETFRRINVVAHKDV